MLLLLLLLQLFEPCSFQSCSFFSFLSCFFISKSDCSLSLSDSRMSPPELLLFFPTVFFSSALSCSFRFLVSPIPSSALSVISNAYFFSFATAFVFASLCSSLSFSDSSLRVISSSTSLSGSLWSTSPPPLALSSVASFAFTFLAKVLNLSYMDLVLTMNSFWQCRLSAFKSHALPLSLLSHVSTQTPPPLPLWLVI